jgi:hypothetical protein
MYPLECTEKKLTRLKDRIEKGEQVRILIAGLGSVGSYLLDYLINLNDSNVEILVVGRKLEHLEKTVNIVKTAACIRGSLASKISMKVVDLGHPREIADLLYATKPDFLVNSSRAYSGLKYGTISWHQIRAYGLWAPLSVKYIKNIMHACGEMDSPPVVINTSYSDATNRWVGTAGLPTPDFGSGNLNHLVPRIKFAVSKTLGVQNLKRIDVTLATSHFHDVLISKEGRTEGVDPLARIEVDGQTVDLDWGKIYSMCAISMPTDYTRNMMNASSNFEIFTKSLEAIRCRSCQKFHSPGVAGLLGGYPIQVDFSPSSTSGARVSIYEKHFSYEDMAENNRLSFYLDGIQEVEAGSLVFTDELLLKVKKAFGCNLPKRVHIDDSEAVADQLIQEILEPQSMLTLKIT